MLCLAIYLYATGIMSSLRGFLGFGRRSTQHAPEAIGDTSDGSGTHISGTPETPQVSASSSRVRRPRGPTTAVIRERSARDAGRIIFQRDPITG